MTRRVAVGNRPLGGSNGAGTDDAEREMNYKCNLNPGIDALCHGFFVTAFFQEPWLLSDYKVRTTTPYVQTRINSSFSSIGAASVRSHAAPPLQQ
jgi:hypothetical protein